MADNVKVIILRTIKFSIFLLTILICISSIFCYIPAQASGVLPWEGKESDHVVGRTIRITDYRGNLVTKTAREVHKGDEIITFTGEHYRVTGINGVKARAKLVGRDKDYLAWVDYFQNTGTIAVTATNWGKRPVGVYHTHTDESYVPTDGKSSIPFRGGIYQVGDKFVNTLQDNGVEVKYYKTPHDPHDNNAYARSRRTAMGLIKNNPIAVFDIHRDGVDDPDFFREEVNGDDIAQLRIVVGRQNPKMSANMDFARRLMAYTNKKYPGVVKEIFKARGNYNQDLLSTAILLEAGTYTNSKAIAENGIKLLAEAVPVVLGVDNPGGGITSKEASKTGWNVALWLILITLGAGVLFALINFGRQGTLDRLRDLGQRVMSSELWTQAGQAGTKGKEYIQGPLANNVRSVRDKIKEAIQRKNKI